MDKDPGWKDPIVWFIVICLMALVCVFTFVRCINNIYPDPPYEIPEQYRGVH